MKLIHIDAQNVLGIRSASVHLDAPINLFAGGNHNGKTSLAEAVRMALGANIHARGVALKKDLQALVHQGAKSGSVEVQLANGIAPFALVPSGKITAQDVYVPHKALPFVLEPERFGTLDNNERRAFLFGLMGLRITPEVVIQKLVDRGVDKDKALRVGPLLKAGLDAAGDEAKRKATEAKGAWRAVTGETYGAVKAVDWKAPVPAHDAAAAKKLDTELKHCDVALETWQQQIGKLANEEEVRAELRKKLPALQDLASSLDRIQKKLAADESGLAEWEQRLQATAAEAGQGLRIGLVHDLAKALDRALSDLDPDDVYEADEVIVAIVAYEKEHGKVGAAGDPDALARLPDVRKSRDLMASAVANGKRDIDRATDANVQITRINDALAKDFDAEGLAKARVEADKLKSTRAELVKKLDAIKSQKLAADAAEKKTADAAAHHADVAAWDAIASALAPDGIPGEMLAAALDPFNDRLAQSAADTEWDQVTIDADMTIASALQKRPYRLLSESEKWRADAMLAEAISHLSGLKLLLLDRFDVLDLKGRSDLLAWLEILASGSEIDTALVFGTLKAIPATLPAVVAAHWVEAGVVGEMKEAA